MSKRIDHEIRDAVLKGLKMGQDVFVHPRAGQWLEPMAGRITGWAACDPFGPDTVEVKIGDYHFDVRRQDLISAEQYDAVEQWQSVGVTA